MDATRIALIQLAWTDRERMKQTYRDLAADAARQHAQIVCLPEFSITPYFPGTLDPSGFDWQEPLQGGASEQFFAELAAANQVYVLGSLFEAGTDGNLYDTATIHNPRGEFIGFTRKVHIPSGDGYNETSFFGGADAYPVHDLGTVKASVPTCYDQWFPEMARICALNGAEFIFYPTAIGSEPSDPNIDTRDSWQMVQRGHAIANGVYLAAANRVGAENGVTFYGSSFVCDPMGRVIAQAGRDTTEVITADLDPVLFDHWRALFPLLKQRVPQHYGAITK
jgi:N-carbamoylputrescine amidase